ncbi:MAG: S53 family peptidase [Chloroflexi bacterium]|nr:S53 family peptidase [Chloroflexota bacterium]
MKENHVPVLMFFVLAFIASWVAPIGNHNVVRPRPFVSEFAAAEQPLDTGACIQKFNAPCYQPRQIQRAYGLLSLFARGLDGSGRTIVIVNPYGSPTIEHDLHEFNQAFALGDPPSFKIIQPVGAVPPFDPDAAGGDELVWAKETTLDVEWAHVMAPGANILLVETPVDETEGVQGFPEIVQAENYVIDHDLGDVISQSFGATEATFPNRDAILQLRSAFTNARDHRVTVLASSGDTGATGFKSDQSCCYSNPAIVWPSSDPLVTSVGGTQLHLDGDGYRTTPDTGWNDACETSPTNCAGASGGGPSAMFARPSFQDAVEPIVGGRRGTPDLSMNSSFDSAVDIYYTFDKPESPWHLAGASSESSPLFAGVVAIADQAAGHRLGWLNPLLYGLPDAGVVDVISGTNAFTYCSNECGTAREVDTTVPGYAAAPGYDLVSGLGTIDSARFVQALARPNLDDNQPADPRTSVSP